MFEWEGSGDFEFGTSINEIVSGLFLCGYREGADRGLDRALHIRLVLCCCASPDAPEYVRHNGATDERTAFATYDEFAAAIEASGPRETDEDPHTFVFNIPADDSPMFDLSPWFPRASDLLELVVERLGGRAVVHCLAGVSRSATIVSAYLMRRTELAAADVVAKVRARRSCVNPNPGFVNQLRRWELMGYASMKGAAPDAVAARIADRLGRFGPGVGAAEMLRADTSARLMSVSSTEEDRAGFGAVAAALDAKGLMPWGDFVEQFHATATALLDDDQAVDTPLLPMRIIDMVQSLEAAAVGGRGGYGDTRMRGVIRSTACGGGDQFAFEPFAFAALLHRLDSFAPATATTERATAMHRVWVHVFAARLRSVLDAGSPIAFPPGLGVNFAHLGLAQLDEWTPAVLPANARRVFHSALAGLGAQVPAVDRAAGGG